VGRRDEVEDAMETSTVTDLVRPAGIYETADDLWIVTSYFNPAGYQSRRWNYEMFSAPMRASGLRLVTIECAFGSGAFELPAGPDVIQVRAPHAMWQKERLLNLAIARLPAACTKVAWVDCDVLFGNPSWAFEASRLLERCAVVQLFDRAFRLPRGATAGGGDVPAIRGFAEAPVAYRVAPDSEEYRFHGQPGLAWAARRSVLEAGLYDACIIGGGDHVIAHGIFGESDASCIERLTGGGTGHMAHVHRWATALSQQVRGALGYVPGAVLHLWHGELSDRQYRTRHRELAAFGFDPETDLRLGDAGCWEWASAKPAMHAWVAAYFAARREDGPRTVPAAAAWNGL
jgi:hypothetical protein